MRYRTIVADPPWQQGATGHPNTRGFGKHERRDQVRETAPPYPTMTLEEIRALPISDLAQRDAHLYLWTTQKFLEMSFDVARSWGFRVSETIVWCKEPGGITLGGAFGATTEFVHFCKRGRLPALTRAPSRWYQWPRRKGPPVKLGQKRQAMHSAKPEAFLDLVEQVSPGPYLEIFARRNRLGWDTWGNESLIHVEIA